MLQREFPLESEPFDTLGRRLGISEEETIRRIQRFKDEGLIRQIGPVLEARKLGRHTILAALRVPAEHLDKAELVIKAHPGISHAYLREHDYNVWITLAGHSENNVQSELEKLRKETGADSAVSLPVVKLYKIGFFLDLTENDQPTPGNFDMGNIYQIVETTSLEKKVLNEIQQDLPLIAQPFNIMSANCGMDVNEFLACCRALKDKGVMRRYGAAVNHRKAGYKANAMTCWTVNPVRIDEAGTRLAACREVSHCYWRRPGEDWSHNLFAMIHGQKKQDCFQVADKVTSELGLEEYEALFSTREIKKERVKYRF